MKNSDGGLFVVRQSFCLWLAAVFFGSLLSSALATDVAQYGGTKTTWPVTWQTLSRMNDPVDSGVAPQFDFVGDAYNPCGYWSADTSNVFFRMRVNNTPTTASTYSGSLWVYIDTNSDNVADSSFTWDSAGAAANHGLELKVNNSTPTTWGGSTFLDDVDGNEGTKGVADINGSARTGDGYVRSVDGQTSVYGTNTTFVDFAVSWAYLTTYSTTGLKTGQTWRVAFGSSTAADNQKIDADVAGGAGIASNISLGWSSPISMAPAPADTHVWTGGGANAKWSDGNNWDLLVAPVDGDNVTFSGTTRPVNTNDTLTTVGNVSFTEGGFTIKGTALTLNGNIGNTGQNTWGINLTLSGTRTIESYAGTSGGMLTISSNINLASSSILINASHTTGNDGDILVSGIISGGIAGVALTKGGSGAGTVTLSGANTYTGKTAISSGYLAVSSDGNLGTAPATTIADKLQFNGGYLLATSTFTLNSKRGGYITAASATTGLWADNGVTLTYAGIIGQSGTLNYDLSLDGEGTIVLSGNSTYTGKTKVIADIVRISHAGAFGKAASAGGDRVEVNALSTVELTGGITVSKNILLDYAKLVNASGNNTWAGGVVIGKNTSGNCLIRNSAAGSLLTLTYPVTIDTDYVTDPVNTYQNLYLEGVGNITISGEIAGDGTDGAGGYLLGHGDVVMNGTGILTLSGDNSYSGRTIVNSGTVVVDSDARMGLAPEIAAAGRVIINSGTLNATASFEINSYRGIALGTALGAGDGTIKVDADAVVDYAGIIADNGSGVDALIKSGAGTLSLTGENTYFGKTTINSGTLTVNGDVCLGTAPEITTAGHLTITNGTLHATASFTLDAKRGIALGPTSGSGKGAIEVDVDAVVLYGGVLANNGGTGGLTKTGAGKLWLSGASTYTGATAVEAGTLSVNGTLMAASAVTVSYGATLAGIGTAAGTVAERGTISAGNSIGTLSTGSETWYGGGDVVVEINDAEGTKGSDPGWDWLNVSGVIDVQATSESPFTIWFGKPTDGIVTNFDCKQSYRWTIASGTSAVLNFSADKFILDASAFRNFLGNGTLSVDLSLDGYGVDVVFTPYVCQARETMLFSAVVDGKMNLRYVNTNGLGSIEAIVLSNCTLVGTAYGVGFEGGVSLGDVPLSPRIDLPDGTTNVLLIATKIDGGLSATVNALSKDLCGNAKSFDPVLLTLTVPDGQTSAMQDLGNLTAAERYVFIRNNDGAGLRGISLIVNGQRFDFDNVAPGEIIRLDIGEALYGDNNTAVLAGSGEAGAGAELIIYDSPDGSMTLSATIQEPVALGLKVNGPEVVLGWPSTGSGFVFVQERESLTSGEWKTLPNATRELNGQVTARVSKEGSCKLYRLFKP